MMAESLLIWLADFAVKGMLVLALALATTAAMKRCSAAARHMVWTLAAIAALILPGLSVALPQWQVPILPGSFFRIDPLVNLITEGTPQQRDATVRYFGALIGLRGSIWEGSAAIEDPASLGVPGGFAGRHNLPVLALSCWGIGAMLMMIPWLAGAWTVWRLGRRAEPVEDAFIANMFRGLLWEYSIRRRVELLVGTQSMTPLAWGVFRPRVLLPPEAMRWPADRLRSVMLHELAHVKRWDCATQLLGQFACAVHWFNPLAWLMARWMRAEHERACDDRVLAWGLGEACYAEHLVQIARSLRAPAMPWMAAVAMARGSQLRDRLSCILDPSRSRGRLSGRITTAALALTLAIVAPLAMIHGADATPAAASTITPNLDASPLNTTALLVTDGNYFLERIFQSMPPLKMQTVTPAEFEESGPGEAGLVIFDRYTPVHTPSVPCIFFAAVSSDGPTHARQDVLSDVRMEVLQPDHPMMKDLNFTRIYAQRALSLDAQERSTILVNGNGQPMIVLDPGNGRRMIVAFDVLQSNWPLRTSFPVFMYRAVENLLTSAADATH